MAHTCGQDDKAAPPTPCMADANKRTTQRRMHAASRISRPHSSSMEKNRVRPPKKTKHASPTSAAVGPRGRKHPSPMEGRNHSSKGKHDVIVPRPCPQKTTVPRSRNRPRGHTRRKQQSRGHHDVIGCPRPPETTVLQSRSPPWGHNDVIRCPRPQKTTQQS